MSTMGQMLSGLKVCRKKMIDGNLFSRYCLDLDRNFTFKTTALTSTSTMVLDTVVLKPQGRERPDPESFHHH